MYFPCAQSEISSGMNEKRIREVCISGTIGKHTLSGPWVMEIFIKSPSAVSHHCHQDLISEDRGQSSAVESPVPGPVI